MAQWIRSLGALLAALCICPGSASASASKAGNQDWLASLKKGGHVIVIRHGATHADQADTDPLNLDNTSKQRHLTDSGRDLARAMGAHMRSLGIPIGEVHCSRFFRAYETAKLAFGHARPSNDYSEGGLVVPPLENERRAAAMRKLVGTMPAEGTNTIVVSHKPNIIDAFGKDWFDVREGEASIFHVEAGGRFQLVRRVRADEWRSLVVR